jgi:hypothetical protein
VRALPRPYTSLWVFNSIMMRDWIKLDRNRLLFMVGHPIDCLTDLLLDIFP